MLDPIADKLLVAACLLMLAADDTFDAAGRYGPPIIILCREILVSGLREFLAELRVSVPVTRWPNGRRPCSSVGDRLPHCRPGRRPDPARHHRERHSPALDRRHRDALYRMGLFPRRRAAPHRRVRVKILYFAWVRERVGKADEEIDPPDEIATVGDLIRWLAGRGEEYAYAFENPANRPRRLDHSHARPEDATIAGAREIAFFPPMTGG